MAHSQGIAGYKQGSEVQAVRCREVTIRYRPDGGGYGRNGEKGIAADRVPTHP